MNLEKKLQQLQSVQAPERLKSHIRDMVETLPNQHRGFYFPLLAFQVSVVAALLLLVGGVGSSFVVAANTSQPGTPLYPVRQMIEKVPVSFINPTIAPTMAPRLHSPVITAQPTKHESKKSTTPTPTPTPQEKRDVRGVSTYLSPTNRPAQINNAKQYNNQNAVENFLRRFFHRNNSSSKGK